MKGIIVSMANKEEVAFNEAKKNFEESRDKIVEAISTYKKTSVTDREKLGISETDYIRLSHVIQLAKKWEPKREIIYNKKEKIFKKRVPSERILHISQNLIKIFIGKNRNKNEIKIPTNSYILGQECIRNLRELRNCDYSLKNLNQENIKDIEKSLDVPLTGQIINTQRNGPGILDDYRQKNWGVQRICLDGMQNHLPEDSKGSACFLHFLVDGKWVDIKTAKLSPEKITKVRFADNGVGFTPDNLLFLHSTKGSEDRSVGQFGEGIKLASMASINLGLGMELQSRNWSAFAIGEDKQIVNTRKNDEIEDRKKLIYDIKEYDGEPLVGSRTIFHTPTKEFIDFALQLPDNILQLNPKYRHAFTTENGDIINSQKGGQAFVKGVFIKNINSLLSYNFDMANINPDRNEFSDFNVGNAIIDIILELNNKNIMKTLIAKMIDYHREDSKVYNTMKKPIEVQIGEYLYNNFKYNKGMPTLWKEVFEEVCEQKGALNQDGIPIKAVLKTDYEIPEQLLKNLAKYEVVSLPGYWPLALQKAGIKTDRDALPEFLHEVLPTSLSLNYVKGIWDDERKVLDSVQNHLPSDSGGCNIFLRFQTIDGEWHDFREFPRFDDEDIKKIKISDDGVGYDFKNLGILDSNKEHEKSSGKWGEGLKMIAASALRTGVKIELRSRNWMATPNKRSVILNEGEKNEKEVEQLIFDVITKINTSSEILEDGDNPVNGDFGFYKENQKSSTTFVEPTPELIKEFRNIKEKVLGFERRNIITSINDIEVLDLSSGKLFIRNILVPGEHNLKYSYHLKKFDIETRERDVIKRESMQKQLKELLENVNNFNNDRFISAFLRDAVEYAKEHKDLSFLEFETPFSIPSKTAIADTWIRVFKQDFGSKTSIRKSSDQDMNAVHLAKHLGLEMITLPDCIAKALSEVEGKDGQCIPSYEQELMKSQDNAIPVKYNDLTTHEKQMIEHLYEYNKMLSPCMLISEDIADDPSDHLLLGAQEFIKQIKVFCYDSKYTGLKAAGFAGAGEIININRDVLNSNLLYLGDVFFHESGHAITGADDAERAFRNYFTGLLSLIAMKQIPLEGSIDDNGLASTTILSDVKKAEVIISQIELSSKKKVGVEK